MRSKHRLILLVKISSSGCTTASDSDVVFFLHEWNDNSGSSMHAEKAEHLSGIDLKKSYSPKSRFCPCFFLKLWQNVNTFDFEHLNSDFYL